MFRLQIRYLLTTTLIGGALCLAACGSDQEESTSGSSGSAGSAGSTGGTGGTASAGAGGMGGTSTAGSAGTSAAGQGGSAGEQTGGTAGGSATVPGNTITGTVTYEGEEEGTLTVAAFPSWPPAGPPSAMRQVPEPVFPQPYELLDVPPGEYHIMAILDVDPPSPMSPGPEDKVSPPTGPITITDEEGARVDITITD